MIKNQMQKMLYQIRHLFKQRKKAPSKSLESLLALASKEPTNGHPHLRIAEIYQDRGEKKKALAEYLAAAEIFCSLEQYHKGVAIYTKILKQDPGLESARKKLADTYGKMGFLAQALAQYHKLFCYYNNSGEQDKALEMMGCMAKLNPQKFMLNEKYDFKSPDLEKGRGRELNERNEGVKSDLLFEDDKKTIFDLTAMLETSDAAEKFGKPMSITMEENYREGEIFKEMNKIGDMAKLYLDYNFQMGLVCKEMGLIDEAIKQFQTAIEKGQKPVEANRFLNQCLGNNGPLEEGKPFKVMLPQQSAIA